MIKILFVDDEPMMLRSLKRMLLPKSKEWEMSFVNNGKAAFDFLEKQGVDIIITDMRMPDMGGVSLLSKVKELYPKITRMVLSGYSDQEMIIKSTRLAHQYIAKPCDAKRLIEALTKIADLRTGLASKGMLELIAELEGLPSPPDHIQNILEKTKDEEASLHDIGDLISKDMGMSTNILKMVNSAYFGLPRHVADVPAAVVLLGMDIIRALVLSQHLFSSFDFGTLPHFSYQMLWDHCMRTACISREITKSDSKDKKEIDNSFIAGLLHDMGKLILGYAITEKYKSIIEYARENNQLLWKAEKKYLGVSHAELGAYLSALWGLPEEISEAIRCHHEPAELDTSGGKLVTAVHLSDVFEHHLFVINSDYEKPVIDKAYIERKGIKDRLEAWASICRDHFHKGKGSEDASCS